MFGFRREVKLGLKLASLLQKECHHRPLICNKRRFGKFYPIDENIFGLSTEQIQV